MNQRIATAAGLAAPARNLLDVLGRTEDAMVAIGPDLQIVGWNAAATTLLGHEAADVIGRPCHEVLCWSDRCGNGVCDGLCPAAEPGEPDDIGATREVLGETAEGKRLWLNASTIVPPPDMRDHIRIVHLIREVGLPPELDRLLAERLGAGAPSTSGNGDARLDALTGREREVLTLLSEGLDGASIAERLFLSPATVRNHIQHILAKLGVHSRVEAVAIALRSE